MLTEFGKVMRIIRINTGDSKDSIEKSAAQVKINLTEMADKKKKLIYKLSKGDIDEETLDKLCEIIRNKENEGK